MGDRERVWQKEGKDRQRAKARERWGERKFRMSSILMFCLWIGMLPRIFHLFPFDLIWWHLIYWFEARISAHIHHPRASRNAQRYIDTRRLTFKLNERLYSTQENQSNIRKRKHKCFGFDWKRNVNFFSVAVLEICCWFFVHTHTHTHTQKSHRNQFKWLCCWKVNILQQYITVYTWIHA